jgi:hypothetical protein
MLKCASALYKGFRHAVYRVQVFVLILEEVKNTLLHTCSTRRLAPITETSKVQCVPDGR